MSIPPAHLIGPSVVRDQGWVGLHPDHPLNVLLAHTFICQNTDVNRDLVEFLNSLEEEIKDLYTERLNNPDFDEDDDPRIEVGEISFNGYALKSYIFAGEEKTSEFLFYVFLEKGNSEEFSQAEINCIQQYPFRFILNNSKGVPVSSSSLATFQKYDDGELKGAILSFDFDIENGSVEIGKGIEVCDNSTFEIKLPVRSFML